MSLTYKVFAQYPGHNWVEQDTTIISAQSAPTGSDSLLSEIIAGQVFARIMDHHQVTVAIPLDGSKVDFMHEMLLAEQTLEHIKIEIDLERKVEKANSVKYTVAALVLEQAKFPGKAVYPNGYTFTFNLTGVLKEKDYNEQIK